MPTFNTDPERYLEFFDGGDLIRIEPYYASDVYSKITSDDDWVTCRVTVKGGVFSGQFNAEFWPRDFHDFKRDLKKLDKNFSGTAGFEPVGGQLRINISGDGLGYFELKCIAQEQQNIGATLSFTMSFDQTELVRLMVELDRIIKGFLLPEK